MFYDYALVSRAPNVGGGFHLMLLIRDKEVAGREFPADRDADPQAGIEWWNGLSDAERAHWISVSKSTVAADAWGAYLTAKAEIDAIHEGKAWMESRERHPYPL